MHHAPCRCRHVSIGHLDSLRRVRHDGSCVVAVVDALSGTDDDLRPVGIVLMETDAKLDLIIRLLEEDDDEWREGEDDAD